MGQGTFVCVREVGSPIHVPLGPLCCVVILFLIHKFLKQFLAQSGHSAMAAE